MTTRAVLIFDGDCGLCTTAAGFVTRRLRPDADVTPYQRADLLALRLTAQQCDAALQWVGADGRVAAAQNAVARVLLAARPWWRPLGAVILLPGVNAAAGLVYRWVAANRSRLPGGTPACSLPPRDEGSTSVKR